MTQNNATPPKHYRMKEELSWNERKRWAKDLFIELEKTIPEIAKIITADESTVRGWIQEGSWDGVKRSLLISKKTQLKRYYDFLEDQDKNYKTGGGETNTRNLDAINKLTAAINNLENEDSVCDTIIVAEQFTNWLLLRDVAFARKVTLQFDAFIKQKLAA